MHTIDVCVLSRVRLFATPWTVGFSRQEYWGRLSFLPPGDHPDPGIQPITPVAPALTGSFSYHWVTWEAPTLLILLSVRVAHCSSDAQWKENHFPPSECFLHAQALRNQLEDPILFCSLSVPYHTFLFQTNSCFLIYYHLSGLPRWP